MAFAFLFLGFAIVVVLFCYNCSVRTILNRREKEHDKKLTKLSEVSEKIEAGRYQNARDIKLSLSEEIETKEYAQWQIRRDPREVELRKREEEVDATLALNCKHKPGCRWIKAHDRLKS